MEKKVIVKPASEIRGTVTAPPDKSISHRAVILAALAQGTSTITNYLEGVDTWVSINALQSIGVDVQHTKNSGTVIVNGNGLQEICDPVFPIDVGTSMTSMRFLLGLFAGKPLNALLTSSVQRTNMRPVWYITEPLSKMGASIISRLDGKYPPIGIRGNTLKGIDYNFAVTSGETKTAFILAALQAGQESTLRMPLPTRDHTERLVRAMGGIIEDDDNNIHIKPSSSLNPINFNIPGEISAAVYWIVLGLVHPNAKIRIKSVGINASRIGLIDVLKEMGGDISIQNETKGIEPEADIVVRSSELKGIDIPEKLFPRMIDEFPGFALAASLAKGRTRIFGANELRNKKSNRIASIVEEYSRLGADISETDDGLMFKGVEELSGGVSVSGRGDHRMANSLLAAGLVAKKPIFLSNYELIQNTSYPHFFDELKKINSEPLVEIFEK